MILHNPLVPTELFTNLISGKQRGLTAQCARFALRVLAEPYSLAMRLRNLAFDAGWKKVHRVAVPVISIGNITTGGTGKTPIVAATVKQLQALGRRPGIISRGYRADSSGANDEFRVLEQLCPGVPHVQLPDRIAAAEALLQDHDIDAIVLDDAMQHRRIHRDLNIALVDATNPFGYGHTLPRGLLRESRSGLRRADLILVTRTDAVPDEIRESMVTEIQSLAPAAQVDCVGFVPQSLMSADRTIQPSAMLDGVPIFVVTGIGNPAAFVKTCEQLNANVIGHRFFPDHHHFSAEEWQQVTQEATAANAKHIVVTQKDLVKLPANNTALAILIEPWPQSMLAEALGKIGLSEMA